MTISKERGIGLVLMLVMTTFSGCAVVQTRLSSSLAMPTGDITRIRGYATVATPSSPIPASDVFTPSLAPSFGISAFISPHLRFDYDFRSYSVGVRPSYAVALTGGKPQVYNYQMGVTYSPIRFNQPIVPFVTYYWFKADGWYENYASNDSRVEDGTFYSSNSLGIGADLRIRAAKNNRSFWTLQPVLEVPLSNTVDERVYVRLSIGFTFLARGFSTK
jgi:hypothetical protein